MDISSRYNPTDIEEKWYAHWETSNYFSSERNDKEPYTILMPPPNVTGVLHMGHMLNITIQDILIRKARIDGKNACWVPGTDHASIATEAKVVRMLREKGIKKSDLKRDEFLDYAWKWKEEYGGIILKQLKKLGASCDWERTAFTMDQDRSREVIKAFIDLYNKNKLYRGLRMVNWDPEAKTVLSNEEVLYNDEQSNLYFVKYNIKGTEDYITIATTRPETILGDTAIAVNPKDERYAHLKGKQAIVPLVNREIPIIFDEYVDTEFGTGALKITPAHDPNDYEIGLKHGLEVIDVINDDGTINEAGLLYIGEDRFEVRKNIKIDLKEKGFLDKIESYIHSVGRSERTNSVIEPKLSKQWYVDMKAITEAALKPVINGDIQFHPNKYINTYRHWMENMRDWCISRQLWWGHRIPAYYYKEEVFVAETFEGAFTQAKAQFPEIRKEELRQDEDVLDTWFSSWLWPMSVFPDPEDLEYYYPTTVLVTGWDIIFLWVARMIMAGYEWKGNYPYKDVYFTGMVRDKLRRKMSKSLGNSPDALKLISDFGADAVRFGMLSCSPAGGDLLFDEKLVEQGRNFCNKLWNMMRLVKSWEVDQSLSTPKKNIEIINWFKNQKAAFQIELESKYNEYRLSEGLIGLYSLIWNDFASWYLEVIKPKQGAKIDQHTYSATIGLFSELTVMLHPFMPFITEELWHKLKERDIKQDCMVQTTTAASVENANILRQFELCKTIVTKIRELRNKHGISPKEKLKIYGLKSDELVDLYNVEGIREITKNQARLSTFELTESEVKTGIAVICSASKIFVDLGIEIDAEEELNKLMTELERQKGFVLSVEKKLSNERFVKGAPASVVDRERKKLQDGLERIKQLTESINSIKE